MDSDNGREQPQPGNEQDHEPETDPELGQGSASDPELEVDLDVTEGVNLLALVTENKVCSLII
jgi:hypothetical protein